MTNKGMSIFTGLAILLSMIAIYTLLIMVIWNTVLIPKVKGANLQKLDFLDALAVSVFFSIITGSTTVINQCGMYKM
jgi:hypothetical protein